MGELFRVDDRFVKEINVVFKFNNTLFMNK